MPPQQVPSPPPPTSAPTSPLLTDSPTPSYSAQQETPQGTSFSSPEWWAGLQSGDSPESEQARLVPDEQGDLLLPRCSSRVEGGAGTMPWASDLGRGAGVAGGEALPADLSPGPFVSTESADLPIFLADTGSDWQPHKRWGGFMGRACWE